MANFPCRKVIREIPYQLATGKPLLRWEVWGEGLEINPTFLPAWPCAEQVKFGCLQELRGLFLDSSMFKASRAMWLQKIFVVVVRALSKNSFVYLSAGTWDHVNSQPSSALQDSAGKGVTLPVLTHMESLDVAFPHSFPNKQKKSGEGGGRKYTNKELLKAAKTEILVCANGTIGKSGPLRKK